MDFLAEMLKSFIQQRTDVKHDLNIQFINFCTRSESQYCMSLSRYQLYTMKRPNQGLILSNNNLLQFVSGHT